MKKILTLAMSLAFFASLSTPTFASGPMRKDPPKKQSVETKVTTRKETIRKQSGQPTKKEVKETKTGGAAPIKKQKHKKY